MKKLGRKPQPKPERLVGLALYNPVSIEAKYSRELVGLAQEMTRETKAAVKELFRTPEAAKFFAQDASIATDARRVMNLLTARFERLYSRHAEIMARRMLDRVDEASRTAMMRSLKKLSGEVTLKIADMTPALRTMFEASISENVDLIKSIPTQYLDKIKGAVNRSITGTGGIGPLMETIQKTGGVTERRARNIAIDQTRKAYQATNLERARASGIKKGTWIHTGGSKEPRPKHKAYNGKEFNLAEGAPIGDKGQNVIPGEEPFCRCTFCPVVDFEDM
jgi:SPP1 gp7 family putative phage head morphogenesis protein